MLLLLVLLLLMLLLGLVVVGMLLLLQLLLWMLCSLPLLEYCSSSAWHLRCLVAEQRRQKLNGSPQRCRIVQCHALECLLFRQGCSVF